MKKIPIILIFIVMLSTIIYADDVLNSYLRQGFIDQTFSNLQQSQNMLFNDNYATTYGTPLIGSATVTNSQFQPVINYDIDSDNYPELFVSSGTNIRMYRDYTLRNMTLLNTGANILRYGIVLYNTTPHLIVLANYTGGNIKILQYNYTNTFNLVSARNISGVTPLNGVINFDCGVLHCVVFLYDTLQTIDIYGFNLSDTNTDYENAKTLATGLKDGAAALSYIANPFTVVHFTDGDVSYFSTAASSTNNMGIVSIGVNSTGENTNVVSSFTVVNPSLSQQISNLISGTFNDGSAYTLAGARLTSNKIVQYSLTWNSLTHAFSVYNTHSMNSWNNIISSMGNTFACHVFDGFSEDYCTIGYNSVTNFTTIMASTDFGVPLLQSDEVIAQGSNYTNYFTPTKEQVIAHAIESNNYYGDSGVYFSDFLTPFGVYKIRNPNYFTGDAELLLSYGLPNSVRNVVVSPMTVKRTSFYDIAALTSSNLYYINDGFVTPKAVIDAYAINPCLNSVWNKTTPVSVSITPKSYNNLYTVRAKATLYYGTANPQIANWSSYYPSETAISFDFIANSTITNGILRMEAEDSVNSGNTYIDVSFTVGNTGKNFGECQTYISGISTASNASNTVDMLFNNSATSTNNSLTNAIRRTAKDTGLPTDIFIVIIILGVSVIVFLSSLQHSTLFTNHPQAVLMFIGFMDLAALIICAITGMLSATFIIIMITLMLIGGGLFVAHLFRKSTEG